MERFVRNSAVSQGPSDRLQVALTFDDGPHPEWTPQVLDALDQARAKATFFVVGRNVAQHPALVVETLRRGHEIGTHLFSHSRESVCDDVRFDDEVARSRDLLEPLLGRPLKWLRFPYGAPGKQRPRAIRQKFGLETVHWSFSSHDGKLERPDDIVQRVAAGLRPGSIVLLHDALSDEGEVPAPYIAARGGTVAALPRIAELLVRRGLSAVTLSELFRR
jgi:peptidoglycan/xylan/chitin deacetylase (PgdA/CDA1 family)